MTIKYPEKGKTYLPVPANPSDIVTMTLEQVNEMSNNAMKQIIDKFVNADPTKSPTITHLNS